MGPCAIKLACIHKNWLLEIQDFIHIESVENWSFLVCLSFGHLYSYNMPQIISYLRIYKAPLAVCTIQRRQYAALRTLQFVYRKSVEISLQHHFLVHIVFFPSI